MDIFGDGAIWVALFLNVFFQVVLFGPLAGWIGKTKGKAGVGFALGALLGLLGLIIVWVMKPTEEFTIKQEEEAKALRGYVRTCPHCAEEIKQEAKKCKHCGSNLAD